MLSHLNCFAFFFKADNSFQISFHISLGSFSVHTALLLKWAKAPTTAPALSRVLVTQCMWRRHDNSNNMSCGLTWCTEEAKCLVDICEDEQISPTLDTTKSAKFIKSGVTDESKGLRMLCARYKIILPIMTSDLLVPVAMQHTGCWAGCVLTANKPLRVQMESNQITSSMRSRLR